MQLKPEYGKSHCQFVDVVGWDYCRADSIAQQCIMAGLLDEIHIDLVPVLLGRDPRLFDHLGSDPIELERYRVIDTPEVTHLAFRILKKGKQP